MAPSKEVMDAIFKQFEIPNIEALTDDEQELHALWNEIMRLGSLVYNRGRAAMFRREGMIQVALRHEDEVDRLHAALPEAWRW
jgi:hypothetical protein